MKVKIYKRTHTTEDTEYEFPLYLYYQGENALSNYYTKITESYQIDISFIFGTGTKIEITPREKDQPIEEYELNCITTEEVYNQGVEELEWEKSIIWTEKKH